MTERILLQGRLPAEETAAHWTRRFVAELAAGVVQTGRCLVLSGPAELELLTAEALLAECDRRALSPEAHLEWVVCAPSSDPRQKIGRLHVMDELFAYGSYSRLRTFLVQRSNALVCINGEKGTMDCVEKSRLAMKPFFPLAATGAEARKQWQLNKTDVAWFATAAEFDALADHNAAPRQAAQTILGCLNRFFNPAPPRVFIVHGHDGPLKYELKDFIQNTLLLGEPLILQDTPSMGRTVIEKLEESSKNVDLVFVLLTPDDRVIGPGSSETQRRRGRQNVIFELGYFYGRLERRSGRVLVLHHGDLELPSDMGGIVWIQIEKGIRAAGEAIRRELRPWLAPEADGLR